VTEDKEIVKRIINGDDTAFEIIFKKYYKKLCAYANRFMFSDEDAEEIVQEVFVKFWEKSDSIDPDSSVSAYLYRSVYNTCLNEIKHRKVKDSYKQYAKNFYANISYNEIEEKEVQSEKIKLILIAIDELPPRCSEIFKLSRFEGLRYQEIATHLSISLKTVEVQMGKALKVLREKFK